MSDAQLLTQFAHTRRHVLRTVDGLAEASAVEALHIGWASTPMTGADAVDTCRREIALSDEVLSSVDLDAPPRWTPPTSVFTAPPMDNGRDVMY